MRIELVISRTKQLPEGAVPALEKELPYDAAADNF